MFCLKKSLTAVKENPKQTCITENTYLKTCKRLYKASVKNMNWT